MSELRSRVVEAMAQAIARQRGYVWELLYVAVPQDFLDEAEAALDAALETLDELRDDWNALAIERGGYPSVVVPDAKYLLAVLEEGNRR